MPDGSGGGGDGVQYVSFDAIVGRNSVFHMLTVDEMDELGGVEWRALNALLWIVGFVSCPFLSSLLFSSLLSSFALLCLLTFSLPDRPSLL
jgi:hypothetical protein